MNLRMKRETICMHNKISIIGVIKLLAFRLLRAFSLLFRRARSAPFVPVKSSASHKTITLRLRGLAGGGSQFLKLTPGHPLHIARDIAAVAVDATQGVKDRRPMTDFRKEGREVKPIGMKHDPLGPIVFELFTFWISAPLSNGAPHSVSLFFDKRHLLAARIPISRGHGLNHLRVCPVGFVVFSVERRLTQDK